MLSTSPNVNSYALLCDEDASMQSNDWIAVKVNSPIVPCADNIGDISVQMDGKIDINVIPHFLMENILDKHFKVEIISTGCAWCCCYKFE